MVSFCKNAQVLTWNVGSVCNAEWVEFILTLFIAAPSLTYCVAVSILEAFFCPKVVSGGDTGGFICSAGLSVCVFLHPFLCESEILTALLNQSSSYHLNAG